MLPLSFCLFSTAAIPELPKGLFKNIPDNVIIVDISNYYPFRDGKIDALENGKVEGVWVAEHFGKPVVKAYNNLPVYTLTNAGKPAGEEGRIAMVISGNNKNDKTVILDLINHVGFDSVDAGALF